MANQMCLLEWGHFVLQASLSLIGSWVTIACCVIFQQQPQFKGVDASKPSLEYFYPVWSIVGVNYKATGFPASPSRSEKTKVKFRINLKDIAINFSALCLWNINPAKKETPHSFKGQRLENKLLYPFVIYMGFLEKYRSYNLTLDL